MAYKEIRKNVYFVGAIDWDRALFDELIPLPDGTSYNSYLVIGKEKTALIDTVEPGKGDTLVENLLKLSVDKIDYIISNHAEQDHSGTIPRILDLYPDAKVVTNPKCKGFLKDLLLIPEEKFIEVKDEDELPLGEKTLKFVYTPWVHWPETMSTYLVEDKIMFTCDFFGSHLATSHYLDPDYNKVIEDAKRYYAEIMMPFRAIIKKNVAKIEKYEIEIIAPSHGPVYTEPDIIINAYKDWISDDVKNEVIIAYISMHGSVDKMVHHLVAALIEKGVHVKLFNLITMDLGVFAMSLVNAATIIMGTPEVLAGLHPAAVYATFLVNALRPKVKFAGLVGSYGWSGRTLLNQFKALAPNLKVDIFEPVLSRGYPVETDFRAIDKLAEEIFKKHSEIGII